MSIQSIANVVVSVDDEGFEPCSLEEFLEANEFEPEESEEIVGELLAKGEYLFGGGAAPEFMVKVVQN